MNKQRVDDQHPFVELSVEIVFNLARIAQCTYQYGDGLGVQTQGQRKEFYH